MPIIPESSSTGFPNITVYCPTIFQSSTCGDAHCTQCVPERFNVAAYITDSWSVRIVVFRAKINGEPDNRYERPITSLNVPFGEFWWSNGESIRAKLSNQLLGWNGIRRWLTTERVVALMAKLRTQYLATLPPTGVCNECSAPNRGLHPSITHVFCRECDRMTPIYAMGWAMIMVRMEDNEGFYEESFVCPNCKTEAWLQTNGLVQCHHCEVIELTNYACAYSMGGQPVWICSVCEDQDRPIDWCSPGSHYVWHDEMLDDEEMCNECYNRSEQQQSRQLINYWNYRPALIYHPTIPSNPKKPLYIGLELEMSWPRSTGDMSKNQWLQMIQDEYEEILYVKSDSSVSQGWEVVTHPMEPEWALENFPFHVFEQAIENGALEYHQSCGTHIHMSRAAFTSTQLWKLLRLHNYCKDACGIIGERGTRTTYAHWEYFEDDSFQKRVMEIALKKNEGLQMERYVPVNVQNNDTIELRYMAGHIDTFTIKKNIQWAKALFEYTNMLTHEDVKKGILGNTGYLTEYLLNRSDLPELQQFIQGRTRELEAVR